MINLRKLTQHRRKRYEKQKYIFKQILQKCHRKIYSSGEQLKTECLFTIPQYVPGMPLFDIKECMRYIISKLQKNKLAVQVVQHDTISVSWEHINVYDQDDVENPRERSVPTSRPRTKKKETYQPLQKKPIYSIHSYSKWAK